MVELLMAMTLLNIGILAIVASLNAGAVTLQRAAKTSTATALANAQMELYRALKYEAIVLDANRVTTLTTTDNEYSCDDAIKANVAVACGAVNRRIQVTATCTGNPLPNECEPSRSLLGPDNKRYRIDTYVILETPPTGRELKRVTVVVRDELKLAARPLVRVASTFDLATGQ